MKERYTNLSYNKPNNIRFKNMVVYDNSIIDVIELKIYILIAVLV